MLQQIINALYRHPLSRLKRYRRFGGYFSYQAMMRGSRQMMKASLQLPPVQCHAHGLPVYFLTGKNYLYQTLFCIRSLVKFRNQEFQFILVDDGSFDSTLVAQIQKQLPGCTIVMQDEVDKNLQQRLPQRHYPHLHQKRKVYPHLKKLTDIHTLPGADWKLVLDSDMLFWDTPHEIIQWLKKPDRPIHMVDCAESYGYSKQLMKQLSGHAIPPLLNVGAIGLNSTAINWSALDNWVYELEEKEGSSYYLEQALTAMLIGEQQSTILDQDKYKVNPSLGDTKPPVLHHYVDLSKKYYYTQAWKKVIS
ncbi:hypothetical protein [Mucilaginibacter sp. RCC_168]|jgi:glycosyltransferase involved in cell wall biosynthesis|uniref:hypothetical protein n=1 Tax=unclassified Mucilaginibacter TaxID=2617802 RepID=UPI003525F982